MNHHFNGEEKSFRIEIQPRRCFLLDLNGVISRRNPHGHVKCWDNFEFLPQALGALRLLAANHYAGIVISRQPCGCDGLPSFSELEAITRRFLLEVALSGGHIAQVYYCHHRKQDPCQCYDPTVGLIARARADHGFLPHKVYFVSEGEQDLEAAREAGCPCIRIQRDAFLQTPIPRGQAHKVASNLYEAAEHILASSRVREPEYAALQPQR